MNLVAPFLAEAGRRSAQTAIIDGNGNSANFGELAERSAALAGAWRARGLRSGDRVLLAMGLGIDLYISLAALWRIGAVAVLPEPALGLKGLRHAARTAAPTAFLATGAYRLLGWVLPELRRLPLRLTPHDTGGEAPDIAVLANDHPALISFTSGSTGQPKSIVRSHGFLAAQNTCIANLLRPTRDDEIDLVAFPAFVIVNLGLGVTSVLPNWNLKRQDTVDAEAIARHIERHGVTRALLPPSVCARLAALPRMPKLRAIFTGGGPVFPDLLERLKRHLPDADIVAVYGSTEAEPIAHLAVSTIAPEDWTAMKSGGGLLAGQPVPQIAIRLLDDEIIVTGDHVNKGYLDESHDASNKLRIDGEIWHRTGDAGRLDGLGRLWLLGRHDARVGALYPFAIEGAARSWPGVVQAALANLSGSAILAIEGDPTHQAAWRTLAAELGDLTVVPVRSLPLDRRHRSKIDYHELHKRLRRSVLTKSSPK